LLAEANVQRTKAWEAVLLLGDESTVIAARAWQNAVYVEQDLCSNDSIDEMEWESAVDTVNQARDRFYVAARESLGVHGGSVEQSNFLQARAQAVLSGFGDSAESKDKLSDRK